MKIKCIENNFLRLNDKSVVKKIKKYFYLSDGNVNLIINKKYIVYGIMFRENHPWFYICIDDEDEYPTAYPMDLFEIIDDKLSEYWRLSIRESSFVFEEWANDSTFYERLVDGDPVAIKQFVDYRTKEGV